MMLEELLDELARLEALSKDQPNDESLVTEIVAAKESVIAEFFKIGLAAAIKRIAAWLVSHPQEKYPEQMLESFGITLGDRTVMNQLSLYLMAVIYILPMCRRSRKFISGIMKKIIVCFLMAGTCVYFMYADTYTSHTARTMYYVAKIKWLHGMDYDNFYGYIYNSRRQADLCDNAEHQRQLYLKFQVSLHSVIQYFDHTVFRDAKKVPNPNYLYSLSVAKSLTGCLEANQDVYLMWEGGEAQYRHDLAVLLNWQGNFYYYLKEYSKAEELVNQSFAQDDLTNNYALRSSILCEEGRTDEALKDINTAISRNSNKSTYFKTRAKIHRKRGEKAQAEEDKRRAEEILSARRNK